MDKTTWRKTVWRLLALEVLGLAIFFAFLNYRSGDATRYASPSAHGGLEHVQEGEGWFRDTGGGPGNPGAR